MKLKDDYYRYLKWFTLIVLPAFGTFVGVVGQSLHQDMSFIVTIITAFATFLGTILGFSSKQEEGRKNGNSL